jgi:hypothetical protein
VSEQFARQIYEETKAAYPEAYSKILFEGWVGFLVNAGLLARPGENFALTRYGRDFLKYVLDRRLATTKPL